MLNSFKIIMVLLFIAVLPAQGQEQQKADSLQKKISKVEEDVQALKKSSLRVICRLSFNWPKGKELHHSPVAIFLKTLKAGFRSGGGV